MKYTGINIPSLERIAKALEKLVEQNERLVETQERILAMYCDAKRMATDEKELKALMKDPRYWKQRDPEMVKRIEEGFKRLYG